MKSICSQISNLCSSLNVNGLTTVRGGQTLGSNKSFHTQEVSTALYGFTTYAALSLVANSKSNISMTKQTLLTSLGRYAAPEMRVVNVDLYAGILSGSYTGDGLQMLSRYGDPEDPDYGSYGLD